MNLRISFHDRDELPNAIVAVATCMHNASRHIVFMKMSLREPDDTTHSTSTDPHRPRMVPDAECATRRSCFPITASGTFDAVRTIGLRFFHTTDANRATRIDGSIDASRMTHPPSRT